MVSFLRRRKKKGSEEGVGKSIELHNSNWPKEVYLEVIYFPSWDPVELI